MFGACKGISNGRASREDFDADTRMLERSKLSAAMSTQCYDSDLLGRSTPTGRSNHTVEIHADPNGRTYNATSVVDLHGSSRNAEGRDRSVRVLVIAGYLCMTCSSEENRRWLRKARSRLDYLSMDESGWGIGTLAKQRKSHVLLSPDKESASDSAPDQGRGHV